MPVERWYITAAAVREWQSICAHHRGERPDFDSAAIELESVAAGAKLAKTEGRRFIYRAKATIGGRRQRIELTVTTTPRPEGPLPQLVRVRRKSGA